MHEELNQYIKKANNIVIFTGAGISTESGIPDFRGPKGIWKTYYSDLFSRLRWFGRCQKRVLGKENFLIRTSSRKLNPI